MSDVSQHTFNKNVDLILGECLKISNQRGGEYEDTWATENQSTIFVDHVLRMAETMIDDKKTAEWKRLMVMASLCDVKLSRMLGPWKKDTVIDLINYLACFTGLMEEYTKLGVPVITTNRIIINEGDYKTSYTSHYRARLD